MTISEQSQIKQQRRKIVNYRLAKCCRTCTHFHYVVGVEDSYQCELLSMEVSDIYICDRYRKRG